MAAQETAASEKANSQCKGPWEKTPLAIGIIVLLTIVAVGAALYAWTNRDGGTLDRARKTGVIRIGYAVEAPYAFLSSDGRVTGESPEIARVIATRLGIPSIEWRVTDFDQLIEGLESGRFDVIAAGMFITPERARRIAFSHPTFQILPALLVYKGNPLSLHSYNDIVQHAQVRVAILSGSFEEAFLLRLGFPESRLVPVPDALAGRAAVREGEADALALSAPTLRWMVAHPLAGLTELAEPFEDADPNPIVQRSMGGFAFRKRDRALVTAWNAELDHFIGSPEHLRLVNEFGFSLEDIPIPQSTGGKPPQ